MPHRRPVDWNGATDPDLLLRSVCPWSGPLTLEETRAWPAPFVRRLRLFGAACVRPVWGLLSSDARAAVIVSEQFADGHATETELREVAVRMILDPADAPQHARNAAGWASAGHYGFGHPANRRPQWDPAAAAKTAATALALRAAGPIPAGGPTPPAWHAARAAAYHAARAEQADLLRDIVPPPGVSIVLDTRWLTTPVLGLARAMDHSGDYSALPILADALQEAGCEDEPILGCCRRPGPHARGNWVVDLIRGRE